MPFIFLFNDTSPTQIYTLSLHDALPIWARRPPPPTRRRSPAARRRPTCRRASSSPPAPPPLVTARSSPRSGSTSRSEEHTSELQSQFHLVCRLLLEKKKPSNFSRTLPAA